MNPNHPWDLHILSFHSGLTFGDIDNLHLPNAIEQWNYDWISICMNMEQVRAYPHMAWDRSALSENMDIHINDIIYLYLPNATDEWNWYLLSMNIPMMDIRMNPHLPWDRKGLSSNHGLTIRDIQLIDLNRMDHLMRDYIPMKINRAYRDIDIICT